VEEYIELVLKSRFGEGSQQIEWIRAGMHIIVPGNIFSMLSWEEIEIRAVGEKTVDPEKLKKITEYESCSDSSPIVKMFWEVFEEFSEEDKQLYLKFVWGRQRLPCDLTNLRYKHTIYYNDYESGESLPKAHTCFF
jgi:E3 ubiquitin-protein ligase HERC2